MAGINLTDLGIDPSRSKKNLLYGAVDMLEQQLYWQNKAANINHDKKAVRAELLAKLENQSIGNLLDLCQKLTTLEEVRQQQSQKFDRFERNKNSGNGNSGNEDPYGF